LVVADNCSDGTALRARKAGARVVERFDPARKSKGYALEYLIETLRESGELDTLEALVVVDADTAVNPKLLQVFDRGLHSGHEWIQCYDTVSNAEHSWRTRLMAYAFSLVNGVMLLGQSALGLSAGLRGNGMCLSIKGLRRVPWTSHGLTEDLEYSWSVRIAGGRIAFAPDAVVYATMPSQGGNTSENQRMRWEYGRRELIWKMLGPVLRTPNLGWIEKTAAAVELTMPTIVTLTSAYLLLTLILIFRAPEILIRQGSLVIGLIGLSHSAAILGLALYAMSPFLLSFLPWRFSLGLLYFPYFAIWKMMISRKGRPQAWLRTAREPVFRSPGLRNPARSAHLASQERPRPVSRTNLAD
jgi:cellulose synthase/poly-beta-1,6-N-acetylglucosamine synthase-like glycosyltransferase